MSYNDRRQQAIEQRESRIPSRIRAKLARCIAHHAGEDNSVMIMGVGGVFKLDNIRTALARRLDLVGQDLDDAVWFARAVIKQSLKAENARRRNRDSRYTDENIGWM